MEGIFGAAQWIWTGESSSPPYAALIKTVSLPSSGGDPIRIRITASSYYELYLNGSFVGRGPVSGDPLWCLYDELHYTPAPDAVNLHIVVVVHNATAPTILALRPAPGGLLAAFDGADLALGTDATWKFLTLPMWSSDTPKRGWAMGYAEDYDAEREPAGWPKRIFSTSVVESAPNATPIPHPETIWAGYEPRSTPYLHYQSLAPARFTAYHAESEGAEKMADIGPHNDTEPLVPVLTNQDFDIDTVNAVLSRANALTFDLGKECIGHFEFEVDAPAGRIIELSGAELLRDGRPWTVRKNTQDTIRYRTREGQQQFHSFGWTGVRYLHLVVRGGTDGITIRKIGCRERRPALLQSRPFHTDNPTLQAIFDLCRRTLEVGAQEHLIDCPTREQAQYWGDAVFIAQSLWRGFGEESYLRWYLDCFLHVPLNEIGQISSVYPGNHASFPDYSLIPLLGQRFIRENTGSFYRVQETCNKALSLKTWYDSHRGDDGMLEVPVQWREGNISLVNFIDHPGLGWHDFPHPGIDREGVSCPLNLFFYIYLTTLSELLAEAGRVTESAEIDQQAGSLAATIRERFFDGTVFHDAWKDGVLSEGTSWQANSLAVYFGLIQGEEATVAMREMLARYDKVCRCSPYFHFYFLFALRSAGLANEARGLIEREWKPMIEGDATTTWEGFAGDEKDSLCHPWSTPPYLYLITEP